MAHISRLRKQRKRDEDHFNEGIKQWWQGEIQQKLREREQNMAILNGDAYKQKDKRTPVGNLIAEVDMAEYLWCQRQYGEDCWTDPDFIRFYRKAQGQTFLPQFRKSS